MFKAKQCLSRPADRIAHGGQKINISLYLLQNMMVGSDQDRENTIPGGLAGWGRIIGFDVRLPYRGAYIGNN